MTDKQKKYEEQRLFLEWEEVKIKLMSFVQEDVETVQKNFDKIRTTDRNINLWDARINECKGFATEEEVELLKRTRVAIPDFNAIMDTVQRMTYLNIVFILHEKGANLLDAAALVSKYASKDMTGEEFESDYKRLTFKSEK